LEATNGGTLQLNGIITNTGGLILVPGTNSVVSLVNGVSVTDGTLTAEEALPHPRTVLCLRRSFAAIVALVPSCVG
jgi:hypothetical protein